MCFVKRAVVSTALLGVLLIGAAEARADVEITQLANSGALVTDGETRIVIDGMVVEPYAIYAGLPPQAASDFARLAGPFADIDLVLASHRHHDHNQPAFACDFMQQSSATRLVTSAEVIGLMREKCRSFMTTSPRVVAIDPQPGQPVVVEEGGARITVFRLSHGKRKYARIENFAHLIEMKGVRLLRIGDAAMDAQAFEDGHAALDQRIGLLDQRVECEHDAVADQALHAVAQNARGNEVQYGLFAVDDQRMAGIVSTLETRHGRGAVGQQIDNLTLALVTPLGADYDNILTHELSVWLVAASCHARETARPRQLSLLRGRYCESDCRPGEKFPPPSVGIFAARQRAACPR